MQVGCGYFASIGRDRERTGLGHLENEIRNSVCVVLRGAGHGRSNTFIFFSRFYGQKAASLKPQGPAALASPTTFQGSPPHLAMRALT